MLNYNQTSATDCKEAIQSPVRMFFRVGLCYLSNEGETSMLTLDKIYHAKFILKQIARKTDLIAAPRLCPDTDLYLKTENLQVTGSFKVRGAYYKISQLTEEERAKGVIACSAGNHAQGVALAATRMGIKSVVCMPDGAPIMKVESTKRLGAEVELVKGTYDDAHDRAVELQEETGMTFIHPYDDELVIAGQGTIGLEILDQLPDVDAVIVPVGGGGLISGVAFAIKSLRPDVKVYGVQAAGPPAWSAPSTPTSTRRWNGSIPSPTASPSRPPARPPTRWWKTMWTTSSPSARTRSPRPSFR